MIRINAMTMPSTALATAALALTFTSLLAAGPVVAAGMSAPARALAALDDEWSWQVTTADVSKSGELGYVTGTYEDSFKGKDGKLVKETGKYLEVWQKQADGSWKAIHDMWNADAP